MSRRREHGGEGELGAEEIAAALRVLERVAADRSVLAAVDADARVRLQQLAGEVARPDLKSRKKLQRELLRREARARRARDEQLRRDTGIRELRAQPVFAPPLPPLPAAGTDASGWRPGAEEPERGAPGAGDGDGGGPELHAARKCYVCKREYRRLHPFYDQLCRACGDENQARRAATVDLRGRVALVTGARVKIGYQGALLLLRAGCRVVALTRFARDAAARYAREPDFGAWRDRLTIYGVDLRHTPSVELLAARLDATLPRLDFQVHNACQTVRRPPGFYGHLVAGEDRPLAALPPAERALVADYEELRAALRDHRPAAGVTSPALLSQATTDADRGIL